MKIEVSESEHAELMHMMSAVSTKLLLHLYVAGLKAEKDSPEQDESALELAQILKSAPDGLKCEIIIELMSTLVDAIEQLKKAKAEV